MLLYIVFCLILVQVKGQCLVTGLIRIITAFTEVRNEDLATCLDSESENLSFPTKWIGCEWSCLDKGFANITEKFKSSNSSCARHIQRIIRRQKMIREIPQCSYIRCKEHCEHSTGNIQEFLREVKTTFQRIRKNNIRSAP